MTRQALPGTPELTLERDVPCQLADGVTTYADVYRPESEGPQPVLLISSPYGKEIAESNVGFAHPSWYARQGYVVVSHDTRGRFRSEGDFNPFFREGQDVAELVEWAAELDGCDGRVATYGFSYPGLNQLLAAQRKPTPLRAIAPAFTAGSPYHEWFYDQGALSLAFAASWSNFLALDIAVRRGDDAALAHLSAALGDAMKWYWAQPLNAYPPLADGHAPFFFDWLAHPTYDEFWQQIEVDHSLVEQPALHVGGWYDVFVRGTVRNFRELTEAGHAPQKLVLGPWHHMPGRPLGGASAEAGPAVVDDWHVRFWNETLKGEASGVFDAPVTAYLIGDGWHDADAWPPSATTPTDWFFHSAGQATSSFGDGSLSTSPPEAEPPDVYTEVASYPPLSAGGRSCCIEGLAPMGPQISRCGRKLGWFSCTRRRRSTTICCCLATARSPCSQRPRLLTPTSALASATSMGLGLRSTSQMAS